ncbi:HesB/YadR/YfhF family protein [Companilactobacillus ginsenosidimutans]|uniref:Iron-sulfur cluster biosynthesis protein n=1 Tax=Companilactobacillus ginsenosidimutans TaxID=1007676 RepID=A0A0H4QFK6_9LACO|nr:iron-sulfur cluster biosynthesis protein [Companilactobacillus ginsenosidimutans]AKP66742.1 iron-sulfur cluster biosynthesis protein [Companilactobacillus ginsenosidimutans]
MKIEISDKAAKWYEENVGIKAGDGIRFYGKVYGKTMVHEGFSIAFRKETPVKPESSTVVNDITYFITDNDTWFFERYDLDVEYDPEIDGPKYIFKSNE